MTRPGVDPDPATQRARHRQRERSGRIPATAGRSSLAGDSVTYQALVGDAITFSGIRRDNGQIYFERVLWGSGSVDTMIWTYPPSLKGQLEAAVEHSAATFRSGDLTSGH